MQSKKKKNTYYKADLVSGQTLKYKEGDYFEVEEIREKKVENGKEKYFVKWMNWPESSNTWEPITNLSNVIHLVESYERNILGNINFDFEKESKSDHSGLTTSGSGGDIDHDIPLKILRLEKSESGNIWAHIEWMLRRDGVKPKDSIVNVNDLKINHQMLLINYYESKIWFPKRKSES
jgi:hypothetical protein